MRKFLLIGLGCLGLVLGDVSAVLAQTTWVPRASMPTPRSGTAAAYLNGRIYVIGGQRSNGAVTDVVERYNPSTNTWDTNVPRMREARTNAAVVIYQGDLYVLGGRDDSGEVLKDVEYYDVSANQWRSFDSMEEEREGLTAVVLGGALYAVGGSNESGSILSSVEYFDSDDDHWEESEFWELDQPRASFVSEVVGGAAYSIGGFNSLGPLSLVQRYVLNSGTTNLASLSPARGGLASAVLPDGIYVMGGRNSSNQVLSTVNRFLPSANQWQSVASMGTPRENASAAAADGAVYVFGGRTSGGSVTGTVEGFGVSGGGGPPEPTNDVVSTNEDVSVSINVLNNDNDGGGGSLSISSFTQPDEGTVTQSGNTLTYMPDDDFNGTEQFTYTVTNSVGSAQGTVTVTVTPVNDPPGFTSNPPTTATVGELYSYTIQSDDVDEDDLDITAITIPSWLTLTDNGNGTATLQGTPSNDDIGTHQVTLRVDDDDDEDQQSFTITVQGVPPATPVLNTPGDGSTNISINPSLSWSSVSNTDSYTLQVSTVSNFSSTVVSQPGITQTSFSPSALAYETQYFWRVRAVNQAGESGWSSVFDFTTEAEPLQPPATPSLNTPGDGARDVSINPTLQWSSAANAASYTLQVSTVSNFSSTVVSQPGITQTSFSPSALAYETQYFWRVRAVNQAGESGWSSVFDFTTEAEPLQPPATPSLNTPGDGARDVSINPTLQWSSAANAASYTLQVSTVSNFSSTVVSQPGITQTSFSPSALAYETQYFWRVRAVNQAGESGWSSVFDFTTRQEPLSPPAAPELLLPADQATDVSIQPVLVWGEVPNADVYTLQVSEGATFGDPILTAGGLSDTSYVVVNLEYEASYFWRVQGENSAGAGTWSAVYSFTVGSEPADPPGVPVPVYPADAAVGVPIDSVLSWDGVAGAVYYQVELGTDSEFQNLMLAADSVFSIRVAVPVLDFLTVYYWRIRGVNAAGPGPWSTPQSFTTLLNVPLESDDVPTGFALEPNYPNPFTQHTRITFQVEAPVQQVTLKIYSLQGQEIVTLHDGSARAGRHEVIWHAVDRYGQRLPSGMYLYRLQAGRYQATRKMVLIR